VSSITPIAASSQRLTKSWPPARRRYAWRAAAELHIASYGDAAFLCKALSGANIIINLVGILMLT
jgi:hypothetical protein